MMISRVRVLETEEERSHLREARRNASFSFFPSDKNPQPDLIGRVYGTIARDIYRKVWMNLIRPLWKGLLKAVG